MTAPDPASLGFKPGAGWKLDNDPGSGGSLVIQKITREPDSIRWYLSQETETRLLPTPPARQQRHGACIVAAKKRQLIYWREQGVVGFDLTSEKEVLLAALDSNFFRVAKFWLSGNEDVLYFIREQYSPPWPELLTQLTQHKSAPLQKIVYSLMVYSFKDGGCRTVKDFQGHVFENVVDTQAGIFYTHSHQEITISDLYSGKVRESVPEPGNVKISLIGNGRVLVWGLYGSNAYQLHPDGKRVSATFTGVFPAYSPDQELCAFWGREGKLYLSGALGDKELVLSLDNFKADSLHDLQPPAWSPGGRQFSLLLGLSRQPSGTLLTFDVPSRTMSIRAQDVLNSDWL